jgi:hypothetical protein
VYVEEGARKSGANSHFLELNSYRLLLRFNITVLPINPHRFAARLESELVPLRGKLRSLCSGSYKGFGKLRDRKVSVVLDLSDLTTATRASYARALSAFATQQLVVTERFNVIRAEA